MLHKAEHKFGWENALEDARAQLREAEQRVFNLRQVVKVCQKRISDNDPWPGTVQIAEIPAFPSSMVQRIVSRGAKLQ